MKADDNIRFIAIGNLVERNLVVEYAGQSRKDKSSKYQNAAKDIIEKLLLISITANERHTESMNGDIKILSVVDKSVRWCFLGNTLNKMIYLIYIFVFTLI
jgi:hypothetical protein